jgi:hypothetical protein
VDPITTGVPGARSVPLCDYNAAVALYAAASAEGLVQRVVEVGGVYDDEVLSPTKIRRPRRSSESSIWAKITDIDDVAAKWVE